MNGDKRKPVTSGWNVLPPDDGGHPPQLEGNDNPRWQFLSAREALQVALHRGVPEEQARSDILRALQEPARKIDNKIVGLGLLFTGAHVGGREWRADPQVDFEHSTLWARATPPGPYETPRRMWVTFKIPRESVDWLWPKRSDEPSASPRRGAKARYDWNAFDAEAHHQIDIEGGIAANVDPGPSGFKQADLERQMVAWCERVWGTSPSETSIRNRIRDLLQKDNKSGQ